MKSLSKIAMYLFLIASLFLFGGVVHLILKVPEPVRDVEKPINVVKPTPYVLNSEKLFDQIQMWRRNMDLPVYTEHQELCRVAEIRVKQIQDTFDHNLDFLKSLKYGLAENLVRDQIPESESLNSWLKSPAHLKDLTANYKYSCVRCLNNKCVQIFSNLENGF